jgi:uncharacterized repeat protein (TIGR01451 family)
MKGGIGSVWLFAIFISLLAVADPYPPLWSNGAGAAIHYDPVAWPSEPANPVNCGNTCGDWKPYTRFQQNMNDPRTQDPSNGGTSPQAYVNVTSSCTDKALPSIYYYLHQGVTAADDVLMFRWRVESAPHNYATGPSAGGYGASNPWSSALWTVLFDVNGSGFRSLAAHLDGSSGAPAAAVDRLVGIWSNSASHSLDYLTDPNIHLLGHNPTGFVGPTGKIMNFHSSSSPDEIWANGSSETVWDYGTTRARTVTQNSCTEYFIDYQIPIALLDATGVGGPKITRTTPISMLFCTANSLNNPFQKDCAINKSWTADATKPAPFGDYLSFNQTQPYSQPIISSVTAAAPTSCPGTYTLKATVQDTLALQSGVVVTSVQQVDFFYWYDTDGDGTADDAGSAWTKITPSATRDSGTLNKWTTSWDASALPKGKYLIGTQALDDNTKLDDGMTPTGVNNRTFSYVSGDTANKIYIGGAWIAGQQGSFPSHSPSQTPSSSENWYGNPDVTGQQVAIVGTAINACGLAPTITLTGSAANVVAGGSLSYTITLANPANNSSAVTVSQVNASLPAGFGYQNSTTVGTGGLGSSDPAIAGQVLTWTYGSPVSLAPGASATLTFDVTATSTAGNYNATADATTSFGAIQSSPVAVAVDAARVSLSITPSANSIAADGTTQLTFTLAYSNDSTVSLSGATLTGSLPSGATYVTCTGGSACGNSSGSLSWTLGTLAGGAMGTATLVMTVPNTWTTSSLTQSATLTATAPDTSTVTKTASRSVAVTGYSSNTPAAFSLTKTASATQVAPGGTVTYTIAYNNYGGTAAANVVITDVLPSGMTYASSTGGGVNASGTVTWSIGTVAAGASGSVTVTVTAANPFTVTNPTSNTATINWTSGSTVTSASATVGVTGQSCSTFYFRSATGNVGFDGTKNLATKLPVVVSGDTGTSVSVPTPAGGASRTVFTEALRFYQDPATTADVPFDGNITSSIYIDRNPGQALNVRTTVYDYNSATGAKTQLGQSTTNFGGNTKGLVAVTVTPSGTLAKNHRLLWIYEAQIDHNSSTATIQFQYAGTVANTYSGGTTFANSNAQYCITPPANLSTQVTVDQSSISAGATPTLTYTIKYANNGSASATNTSLVNTLPSGFTGCEYSLNNSTWANCSGASSHTFSLGTVTAGGSGTLYVRGVVPGGTTGGETYTNGVSLSSDQTSAVTATAVSSVVAGSSSLGANLVLSLASNASTAQPGDSVVYTLVVTNIGDTAAAGVVVDNALPLASYFTYNSCTGGCSNTAGTLSWTLGALAAGASQSYSFTMDVGSTGLGSGVTVISDDASVTGNGGLSATSNTVSLSLNGNPELAGSLTPTPNNSLSPGDTITYSISLQNTGNASATDVVISDPIPANTSFKGSITATAGSGTFDTINNRVLFTVGTLAAGASETFSFQVTVNDLASGNTSISNTASASGSNAASINLSANASASAAASLDLTQVAVGSGIYPAATLTANASGTTLYVDRTDAFQLGQYVKIGNTVGRVQAISGQSLLLDTSVTASAGDILIGAITFNLAYQNLGDAPATSVTLTDTLPAGLGYYTSSPLATSAPAIGNSGAVSWTIGTLGVGESGTRSLIAFPTGTTGTLTSQGALSAGNAASDLANASIAVGGISVAKSTTTPLIAAAGTASYSITLTNSLASPVTNLDITDSLADGFSYKAASATVGGVATAPSFDASDTASQQPQWNNLTVPANGSLVINFQADAAASAGAGTYQNEVTATAPAGVGVLQYDALASTAEDVTLLGGNSGVLNGYVFYRNTGSSSSYVPGSDLPLAGVRVEIYKLGADCTDPYSATCFVVFTDANGYFQKVVAAEGWYVKVVANTGELSSSWDQVVGDNATQVQVPDQSSLTDYNGFKLTTGYLVSASAGVGGSISPASATVTSGNTTSFTVTPDTGYSIASTGGTCGGNLSGTTYTTTAITAACTVTASFSLTTYAVVFDLAGGTRTGGGLLNQTVAYGSGATAPTFTLPTGKTFTGWSTTFSSITGPLTVTALYTDTTYTVTPSAGTGGSISPAVGQSVVHGNTTSFTLTPSVGYLIDSVTGTCGGSLSGSSFTTSAISANCTVEANFVAASYAVVFDLDGGTRTGGGLLSQTVTHGGAATAPALTPPTGKTFTSWSVSFSSVTGPLTVTAIYTDSIYTVTPSAGAGGSISPATGQSVIHGNTTSFTLTPTIGFAIDTVGGTCGGSLSGSSYTTNTITADCSVIANFTTATYPVIFDLNGGTRTGGGAITQTVSHGSDATVPSLTPPVGKTLTGWSTNFTNVTGPLTVTAIYTDANYSVSSIVGSGGDISPVGVQIVSHGQTATFTLIPDIGYSIASVTGCDGTLTSFSYTTAAILANCTVQVSFSLNSYPVVFNLNGGSRTGAGALNQTISYGAPAIAPEFTPPSGKTFTGWSSSFNAITGPLTVTAIYDDITHLVTPSAGTGGVISPAGVQTIIDGQTASFTLTSDSGYSLVSVAGSCGGTLNGHTYTTNAITADCTVQASFSLNNYPVIFNLAGGTYTGGGALNQTVIYGGAALEPTLVPPLGKTFTGWSASFNSVTGPLTITALYGTKLNTVTSSANTGGSISPAGPQTITYGGVVNFLIVPAVGYGIDTVTGSCSGSLNGNIFTTDAIVTDCSVVANFAPANYPVTFDLAGGVRVGGGALSQSVPYGGSAVAPEFSPPDGRYFAGWSTSFSQVTGPITVVALYTSSAYKVTPSASEGGSISPETVLTIGHGNTTDFLLTAQAGYKLGSVAGSCGGTLNGQVYTTNPVVEDCSVAANFVPAAYEVIFDLLGGQRTGGGELGQSVGHGADAVAPVFTPPSGKVFVRWSTTFTSITGPLTVTALYADDTYTVTATASAGGSITPAGSQTVAYNTSASFQVLPEPGFAFAGATGDCVGHAVGDIYTSAPVQADCSLHFSFNPQLKGVDEQGNGYTGDILPPGANRNFSLVGGKGVRKLTASVRRLGTTSVPGTEPPLEFLDAAGGKLVDKGNGNYSFVASRSGRYSLTFTDENDQSVTMVFTVYPSLGFTSTYQESTTGKTTQVKVALDDDPVDYPVSAPFSVDGSLLANGLPVQGEFTIASGRIATLEFVPNASSGTIDFTIAANGLANAVLGDITQHRVALKEAAVIPLNLTLSAQQAGDTKTVMLNTGGTVTLGTSLSGPGYSYDWSASAAALGIGSATGPQPTFDPTALSGPYLVKVTVRETAAPNRSQTAELLLRIVASEPVAYKEFYDLEYQVSPYRLPICTDGGMERVDACHDVLEAVYMETLSTYEITLGRSSDFASWRDQEFALATESRDIRNAAGESAPNQKDPEYTHLGYQVDFEISGLEQAGQTVPVVIPLKPGLVIPANAVWRKYSGDNWHNFVENAQNQVHSAKRAANGMCPSPSADEWTAGLKPGDDCLRLIIQDGGPNDLDGRADNVIRDPGVLAVKPQVVDVTTVGKGKGGATDKWLMLLLAFALVYINRNSIQKRLGQKHG